jgi:hypothetical protein
MNCCFEDVRVLDELLDKYDDDWDQVPSFILNSSLSLSLERGSIAYPSLPHASGLRAHESHNVGRG